MRMKPDFSGDYVLDRKASALSMQASGIATARMRITHEDPRFACSARFASADDAIEFSFERFTDGRQHDESSRCSWEENTIVSEDRIGPVIMTWRYEIIDDGRRMRATERIRGGGGDQDNVWEFERQ
jgi:hypothetical protein